MITANKPDNAQVAAAWLALSPAAQAAVGGALERAEYGFTTSATTSESFLRASYDVRRRFHLLAAVRAAQEQAQARPEEAQALGQLRDLLLALYADRREGHIHEVGEWVMQHASHPYLLKGRMRTAWIATRRGVQYEVRRELRGGLMCRKEAVGRTFFRPAEGRLPKGVHGLLDVLIEAP